MATLDTRSNTAAGRFALTVFGSSAAVFALAMLVYQLLRRLEGPPPDSPVQFPPSFCVSTFLLLIVSTSLQWALVNVRRERQPAFRRGLAVALVTGTLFVGVQSFGLHVLLRHTDPAAVSFSAGAFAFVMAALHALHVGVAVMFLVYVTIRSRMDRYDHEYYWGVTVCTFFWHALGIVWMAILAVFLFGAIG